MKRILTTFPISFIAIAAIINLRNLPLMAKVGLHSIFFYSIAALFILIPSALVCAELSTAFSENTGGIYTWVRRAFGEKTGFLAIWSEWFNNVVAFPTSIAFIATAIAYLFNPDLSHHKSYMFIMMMAIIWGTTFYNFLGLRASCRLNYIGTIFGILIPGLVMLLLAAFWLLSGHPSQIHFSARAILPTMHMSNIAFMIGVFSAYAGMQIIAFHARNVVNPARTFPRAILLSTILIFLITLLVSLAIAVVVPVAKLNIISGLFSGFQLFLANFHIAWLLPILIILIAISCLSELSAWLLGPARGVVNASKDGLFPKFFAKEKDNGAPTNTLLLQAVIVSFISLLFIFMPSFSIAFWLLMVLTSQFTMVAYILMFGSAIRLRHKDPQTPRPFKIPGNKLGVWIICGLGIIAAILAIILSFAPPSQLHIQNIKHFEMVLIAGDIIYLLIPIVLYYCCKKQK